MDKRHLPYSINISGVDVPIDADYRNVLDIFSIFNSPDLLDEEKMYLVLEYLYDTDDYLRDPAEALRELEVFINGGVVDTSPKTQEKPLYDWDQDFDIIVSAVNHVLGYDCREKKFLHWWTFLSAFMEIGECTFSTYVAIRDKKNKGKKLDKWEQQIYKDNRDRIVLKKKIDKTTQAIMDELWHINDGM